MLETFQIIMFLIVLLILIYVLVGRVIERFRVTIQIHFIHQSGIGIVIGWLVGMLVYFIYRSDLSTFNFNDSVFFYGLLPPIIFAAGYNLKKRRFFQYFFYIFLYGIIGTIICFLITFALTRVISQTSKMDKYLDMIIKFSLDPKEPRQTLQLSPINILLFSATICASDAVAALTLIGQKHDKVFSIVFGESLINDAVSIILFRSVYIIDSSSSFNAETAFKIIGNFLYILVASVAVGLLFAIICCLMFKKCRFLLTNPVSEVTLVIIFGLLGYAFAEIFDLSGVISLLVIGIALSHYNFYNLSMTGQVTTGVTLQSISTIAQGFIFVYLGLNFWTIFKDQNGNDYWWSWSFVGFEIAICMVSRIVSVYVISGLIKLIKRKNWKVNCKELTVVWYSGIVRGSVAFALILTVQANTPAQINQIQVLKSSVLFMVFFTTILIGGFMPLVIKCSLKEQQEPPKDIEMKIMGHDEETEPKNKKGLAARCWSHLDQKYFKKWFIYNYVEREESIRKLKELIKKETEQNKLPYLSILMASINISNQSAQHPQLAEQKEQSQRRPSI